MEKVCNGFLIIISKLYPRTNARMSRVDRNWTKSGGRPSPMAGGFVSG